MFCVPSEDSDRDTEIRNIRHQISEIEEELLRKKLDETVIYMEEPNYQFEDINGIRQNCHGPVGPSGTRRLASVRLWKFKDGGS